MDYISITLEALHSTHKVFCVCVGNSFSFWECVCLSVSVSGGGGGCCNRNHDMSRIFVERRRGAVKGGRKRRKVGHTTHRRGNSILTKEEGGGVKPRPSFLHVSNTRKRSREKRERMANPDSMIRHYRLLLLLHERSKSEMAPCVQWEGAKKLLLHSRTE